MFIFAQVGSILSVSAVWGHQRVRKDNALEKCQIVALLSVTQITSYVFHSIKIRLVHLLKTNNNNRVTFDSALTSNQACGLTQISKNSAFDHCSQHD